MADFLINFRRKLGKCHQELFVQYRVDSGCLSLSAIPLMVASEHLAFIQTGQPTPKAGEPTRITSSNRAIIAKSE